MKKVMKVFGIVVLCVIGVIAALIGFIFIKNKIQMNKPVLPDDYYTYFHSDMPLEQSYAGRGTYEVSNVVYKNDDQAIENIRVWYPAQMEQSGQKYPMILVVNASNTAALNYEPFFARLASWGFIVVGNDDRQTGTGASASTTLDQMLAWNAEQGSVFFEKIDDTKIGCIGYSQGGAGAIRAVTEFENSDKYTALFTGSAAYALLSNNLGWGYDAAKIQIPYFMTAGTGTSDDAGNSEIHNNKVFAGVAPRASLEENYDHISEDFYKVMARVVGAEHQDMLHMTDGYMTAWMLWQLCDDAQAQSVFCGENAEINQNSGWQDIRKNG